MVRWAFHPNTRHHQRQTSCESANSSSGERFERIAYSGMMML